MAFEWKSFFLGSFVIKGNIKATIMAIRPYKMKRLRHPKNKTRKPDVAKATGTATSPAALPSPRALPLFPDSKASDNRE